MKDISQKFACLFVIGKSKAFNPATKRVEDADVFCSKIQSEDSVYCPKHVLITKEHEQEYKRRAAKAAITRDKKKILRDALEQSPLKAVNPKFSSPSQSAYAERGL